MRTISYLSPCVACVRLRCFGKDVCGAGGLSLWGAPPRCVSFSTVVRVRDTSGSASRGATLQHTGPLYTISIQHLSYLLYPPIATIQRVSVRSRLTTYLCRDRDACG